MYGQGLSAAFCEEHMPDRDGTVILRDEGGHEWDTVYKAEKTALSGGWRGFAMDHRLDAGDALIFERVEPTKLQVQDLYLVASTLHTMQVQMGCTCGLLWSTSKSSEFKYFCCSDNYSLDSMLNGRPNKTYT